MKEKIVLSLWNVYKKTSGLVNPLFKTDFQHMFQAEAIYRHFRKSAISSVLDLPNTVDLDQPLSEEAVWSGSMLFAIQFIHACFKHVMRLISIFGVLRKAWNQIPVSENVKRFKGCFIQIQTFTSNLAAVLGMT